MNLRQIGDSPGLTQASRPLTPCHALLLSASPPNHNSERSQPRSKLLNRPTPTQQAAALERSLEWKAFRQ